MITGLGRPGGGDGSPLQYSCLENPMDGGAWRATVHGVAKNRRRLSHFTSLHFFSRSVVSSSLRPHESQHARPPCLSPTPGVYKESEVKSLSRVRLFVTLWTIARQAPPSMGFSRQEYWSGLPFPSPGDFPTQGSNPGLPHCRQMLYHLSHQGSQSLVFVKEHLPFI